MPRNLRTETCVSRLALLPGRTKAGAPASLTMVLGRAIESYGEGRGEVKKTEASTDLKRIADDKSRKRSLDLARGFARESETPNSFLKLRELREADPLHNFRVLG